MSLSFFIFDAYNLFIWPAFIFTFICFFYLYLKTKNELQKQEKAFLNELKQVQFPKGEFVKPNPSIKKALSGNNIF